MATLLAMPVYPRPAPDDPSAEGVTFWSVNVNPLAFALVS
jgi:hypothetical protein